MELEAVKRRGRKRKRKNVESEGKMVKKSAVGTGTGTGGTGGRGGGKSRVLVGRYVKKEFDDSGEFLGKIVSYNGGLYRVDYEDGDCEDLETREVKGFLVGDGEMDAAFHKRRKALDGYILKKYDKLKAVEAGGVGKKVENVVSDSSAVGKGEKVESVRTESGVVSNGVELVNADKVESSACAVNGVKHDVDNESSSDVSDCEPSGGNVEFEIPLAPPPELPPSSGNIGVCEEDVSYLLSVYSFLRSFSVCLFLSPFGLDEFVGALNSSVQNTLLDAIHVALMRALKSHLEILSSEDSELASKCLRSMDWSLLDSLTWPVFIVQYLTAMKYTEGPEWKEFYVTVLGKDYHTLSAGRKLTILQLLCDDASNSAELRAEIDMREASEFGLDPDRALAVPDEIIPKTNEPIRRRGRPRKYSVSKDQEDVKDISESHTRAISSAPNDSVSKPTDDADVDEDGNGDECRLCGMDGTLICCDGCPSSYHSRCIGVMKMFIPQGDWFCPECTIIRSGPKVTKRTSLRGAEFFGVDPYEQVFLGSCDHLLVMKTSKSLELHIRYYSRVDIQKVLNVLTCLAEHRTLYMEICKGICQYWEIPEHILCLTDIEVDEKVPNKDGESSTPSTLQDQASSNVPDVINTGNVDGVSEDDLKDKTVTLLGENCKELGLAETSLNEVKDFHQPYVRVVEDKTHLGNCTNSAGVKTESSSLSGKLGISENGNSYNKSNVSSHNKEPNLLFGGRAAGGCLYDGSSFKPQAYLNVYIPGDFAASAGASLAILSSEEKLASQPQSSISHKKYMSINYSLQAKAFAIAAKRFYWPNYEKKLVEVPRERCNWCLACQAVINSKRGCLLNAAASNAIKGAVKIVASLRESKNVEGSLASIATYVMFMEESLRGLTVGPFLNGSYRNQWRKLVDEAATLGEIKAFLLEFENNIRDIAFSADWIRLVDDIAFENQVTQNAKSVVGSTQKRGPGRRGRKPSTVISEPTDADGKEDSSSDIAWWRGGLLSKHIFQKGVLPQKMIKHAARQGGCAKINGVQYVDGLEVPKRSRQFIWRAAVDMSKTESQLALQVRYLDLHVRWNELVCPEQPLQDAKGPEAEASAFRNARVIDKKIVGNKISYGVVFENQKHLPSRVLKKVLEVEETLDKKEKNWFVETHIPLYLIKSYEMKVAKTVIPSAVKDMNTLSSLHKRKFKASGKNIFSFLVQKRDNEGKCFCTSCQLDVPFRVAAKCSACQGYCHEQCTVGSSIQTAGNIKFLITCKRCYIEKVATPQNKIVGDSPTSPLLLRGQESQQQQPTRIVIKVGKQNGFQKPIEYPNQSSQKKNPPSNLSKKSKSGKKNDKQRHPYGYFDQSYGKRHLTDGSVKKSKKKCIDISNSKASKYCLGLIWKKRSPADTGIDFRLNNILLKNNPNGHLQAPICQLCAQPYNSDLMYICCEKCKCWFHADSVDLPESKIMELFGFKCSRCRRIRIPICPYTNPEERKKLEARKAAVDKIQRLRNLESDSNSDSETNDDQQIDWEHDSPSAFDSEDPIDVQEEIPYFSYPMVDQVDDLKHEMDFEPGPGSVSKKLPVRRHIRSEKESDGSSANNLAFDLPANYAEYNPKPTGESSTPIVEWDVSANGFEDNMMFDYGDLNYEDMEFEPQTYFSFNELIPEDGVQPNKDDRGDPPGDVTENMVNPSAPSVDNSNPDQLQMGVTYDQQEPMFSIESGLEMVPCRVCSQADPCPDLFCENCGLWLHQHCSPWDEDSSWDPETGWKCGNCREWC